LNEHFKVWILDPVDGTKGFMRGQHFCVALALVDRGKPRLSTMGCPNLNIFRVLQGDSYDDRSIDHVDPFIMPDEGSNILKCIHTYSTYIHIMHTYIHSNIYAAIAV
jgi:hypothetical protein